MIQLYKNNAYQWFMKDHIYTIGYAFYQNKLYEDASLVELIVKIKDTIEEKINQMTGYFAIVIEKENGIILISDIIRSFPLFYNADGDVTDDINLLKGNFNELSIQELLSSRWVSNDATIYQNVKQIENAQIVEIENGHIIKKRYFHYEYNIGEAYSLEELDQVFKRMIEKTIRYLNGRTAIVPLSGGNDSRLLLYYLKSYQYPKIITYTYGRKDNKESEVSKKVAKFLDVPWYFIEYTKKNCRQEYEKKANFSKMADYLGRGYSIPHIQEWEAIKQLIDKNLIEKDSVVLPGFTLDFLAGNHINKMYLENKKVYFNKVKEDIYSQNYNLIKKFDNTIFDEKLKEKFHLDATDTLLDRERAANLYEKYDFEERQVKFITNAVRVYDYYGLKWYLPFWEKELILFWSKVKLEDKYSRKFFKNFTQYKYKELMEHVPTYEKKETKGKMKALQKIYQLFYIYNHNPLNYYYYFKFTKYLKYAIIEKNFAYDHYVANDYVQYLRRSNENGI